MNLPLANILHHTLRSTLSALGIGIGICMLVTLSGLARGTLYEVADRWEQVRADLIAYPDIWGDNLTTLSGVGLPDKYAGVFAAEHGDLVERVAPVFLWHLKLGGQDQTVVGVDAPDADVVLGGRGLLEGRLFDPDSRFSRWLEGLLLAPSSEGDSPLEIASADLSAPSHNGLELVIDSRLAAAGGYRVGDRVSAAGHEWSIVGIVPAGGMARVYMPRRAAQFLFGSGDITKSTILFVRLRAGADPSAGARALRKPGVMLVQVRQYRAMLEQKFGVLFRYVDAVNVVALVIAFLFVMITLYTMVLQRTREIAILKSSGASDAFILRQVVCESLLLTGAGTVAGLAMSFAAAWAIETAAPLYIVTITGTWVLIAVGAAAAGAIVSALYPAWRASRVDLLAALTLE